MINFFLILFTGFFLLLLALIFVPYKFELEVSYEKNQNIISSVLGSWFWKTISVKADFIDSDFECFYLKIFGLKIYSSSRKILPDFESGMDVYNPDNNIDSFELKLKAFKNKAIFYKRKILKYKFIIKIIPDLTVLTLKRLFKSFKIKILKVEILGNNLSYYNIGIINGFFSFLRGLFFNSIDLKFIKCYPNNDKIVGKTIVFFRLYYLLCIILSFFLKKEIYKAIWYVYKERK